MNMLLRTIAISFAALTATAAAQNITGSGEFSLQGRLTTQGGQAVADGQHNITVKLYKMGGSGAAVYTETDAVTTVDGVFSTMVGDNGVSDSLSIDADAEYELGVSVDGQAEFSPRIRIGDAVRAISADVAANAEAVGGVMVSTSDNPKPGTLVPIDANGRLSSSLIANSAVTSVNGLRGNVQFDVTGQGVSIDTTGGVLRLNVTGTGGGAFTLPFSGNLNDIIGGQSGFKITGQGEGSVASFLNTGVGSALQLTSSGNAGGAATIDVSNSAGSAIDATGMAAGDAVLRLRNTSTDTTGMLITGLGASGGSVFDVMTSGRTVIDANAANALDVTTSAAGGATLRLHNMSTDTTGMLIAGLGSSGNAVFDVMANGRTMIDAMGGTALDVTANGAATAALRLTNTATDTTSSLIQAVGAGGNTVLNVGANGRTRLNSSVGDALEVATSASGEAALSVQGGLKMVGPVGTGTVDLSNGSVTINNAYAKANSVIMLTVTSASNAANIVPVRVSSQGNGSFTVSAIAGALGALTGTLDFNYLIINQ